MKLKLDKTRFDAAVNKGIAHLAILVLFLIAAYEGQVIVRTLLAEKEHSQRIVVKEWQANIASDVEAISNCKASNFTSPVGDEVNWAARADCVAKTSVNVKTTLGHMLNASILSSAIRNKVEDQEKYQKLAQDMIVLARGQLVAEELAINKSLNRADEILNSSITYRLKGGYYKPNLWEKTADRIDQLEMSIYKPDLILEQEEWRLKVRGQTDCKYSDGECIPVAKKEQA